MKVDAPNIILITVDCLRFDHLGCCGYRRDITPNIDNLASKGALFLQAVSNGGQTHFAFPSILASALPPLERLEHKEIMRRSTTLAEMLKETGYSTGGFHSNPMMSRAFNSYYAKGFDIFEDNISEGRAARGLALSSLRMKLVPLLRALIFGRSVSRFLGRLHRLFRAAEFFMMGGPPTVRAREMTGQVLKWREAHRGKFLLWLHYMDVHMPYMPLPEYLSQLRTQPVSRRKMVSLFYKAFYRPGQLSPSEVAILIDLYDAEIKHVDDAIGRLLDSLGDDLANTIIIITADHGDEFGEHGKFTHQTVYDGIVHVPLIIAGPGINEGTVVKQQVSLLDLAPTVADIVGIDSVPGFQGESLLPAIKGEEEATKGTISTLVEPGQRMIAYRTPGWKYIRTESLDASETVLAEELYDLTDDPGEIRNLHGMGSKEAEDFELEAKNKLSQFKKLKIEEKTVYEKQKIKARIKRLEKL